MNRRNRMNWWLALLSLVPACGIAAPSGYAGEAEDVFSGVDRLRTHEMGWMRAGDGNVTTNVGGSQDFQASTDNNSFTADVITNGAVSVTGEAMKDFSGVANVVFTTGNSNSVNAAINLIVVLGE